MLVGDSKQYLILPGFGIISHVIISAAKKPIFGYLGMVYGVLLCLLFRCDVSQLHANPLVHIVGSVVEVATLVTRRGKASIDSRMRSNIEDRDCLAQCYNMITLRNLTRSAGTALSYWFTYIYNYAVGWLISCVQVINHESTRTALQLEDYERKNLNLTDFKIGIIKTTGFNPVRGKRSIHSNQVHCVKGNRQTRLFDNQVGQREVMDLTEYLDVRSWTAWLINTIKNCKNKDGRYGNLIQVIGSIETLVLAYLSIKRNKGISSKGVEKKTLDGITEDYIKKISKEILEGYYKFSPVRMVEIPKPGKSELRSLDISNPRQKIVQKAMDMVFNLIFEEVFLDCSHGFRPNRSCHSALKRLQLEIGNTSAFTWVIEGDIKSCFPSIPHNKIVKGLRRRIDCPYTINLVKKLLSAGYVINAGKGNSNQKVFKSDVGTPQGVVVSPLFSNLILHELDKFVMNYLTPKYTLGKKRKSNSHYRRIQYALKTATNPNSKRKLLKERKNTPSKNVMDEEFKRIFYVRYADDWIILMCGSYKDAVDVREFVSKKLHTLGLTLN